ncbi:origin recognition complex subunit 4 [Saxophila tyrrhenica]|uniref:Origin recognition complex subunit 4 n=1 Tax=Saxophila tyrrhenica TaxID=1690608 RepID=A0AAV9P7B5_9PEZI|nr:origin recognition complex subunit 4 [Saxophila tyrrhenica]
MSSHRSTKRRKLDATPDESPGPRDAGRKSATPATYSRNGKNNVQQTDRTAKSSPLPSGTKSSTAAHDAYQRAKAEAQALRGKRPGHVVRKKPERAADVYEDIEGAHVQTSTFKQKPAPASTPLKQRLDPLRNQRSGASATSSPSKGGVSLDFFKQFSTPKAKPPPETASKSVAKAESLSKRLAAAGSAGKRPASTTEQDGKIQGTGKTREVERPADTNQSAVPPKSHEKASERWEYADKPKKTFEDEIHDLENAAREQAENDEDEETSARTSRKRRSTQRGQDAAEERQESASKKSDIATARRKPAPATSNKMKYRVEKPDLLPAEEPVFPSEAMEIDEPQVDEDDDEPALPKGDQSVQVNGVLDQTPQKTKPKRVVKPSVDLTGLSFASEELQYIQGVVIDMLSGKRPIPLKGLDTEHAKVSSLISQTITAGESNSMLVIGARGSGKSALVNHIIREQTEQHADDFHVVRLNGLVHTDDKIALREIWRQLGREMEVDEDESAPKNYADTVTTLLALLSHPAEQGREQGQDQITKSVIFIIDEFELFATHPRQTLLYNLFDIAQSRKAPIAVLGLTTRVDVTESLEKRVKSRFSHRYVHIGMPKSFVAYQEACKASIMLDHDDLTEEEREGKQKLQKASKGPKTSPMSAWNTHIDALMADELFATQLRRSYYTTKSVPQFHTSMLLPIATMPTEASTTAEDLLEHLTSSISNTFMQPPDSKLDLLSALSTLHMALLICAARLTAIHSVDNVPFAQAYEEYKVLASKAKLHASSSGALAQGAGIRVWSKDVARDAWEDLLDCGLVLEDGVRGCRVDVGLEEIGMSGVDLGTWGRWCKQI